MSFKEQGNLVKLSRIFICRLKNYGEFSIHRGVNGGRSVGLKGIEVT